MNECKVQNVIPDKEKALARNHDVCQTRCHSAAVSRSPRRCGPNNFENARSKLQQSMHVTSINVKICTTMTDIRMLNKDVQKTEFENFASRGERRFANFFGHL